MKIESLPDGIIIWSKEKNEEGEYDIIGIKGLTLPPEYYERECSKVDGNPFDYELED